MEIPNADSHGKSESTEKREIIRKTENVGVKNRYIIKNAEDEQQTK